MNFRPTIKLRAASKSNLKAESNYIILFELSYW